METEVRCEQLKNAFCPMLVTEVGIVMERRDKHTPNTQSTIEDTEVGMTTLFREWQSPKAPTPIVETEVGITID